MLLTSVYEWVRFELSLSPLLPYCKTNSGISGRCYIQKDYHNVWKPWGPAGEIHYHSLPPTTKLARGIHQLDHPGASASRFARLWEIRDHWIQPSEYLSLWILPMHTATSNGYSSSLRRLLSTVHLKRILKRFDLPGTLPNSTASLNTRFRTWRLSWKSWQIQIGR